MRGAMWSPKVTYSTRCVAGFGLVATKPLTKGEVLFVAPKSACLVSRKDRGDTQRRAATKRTADGSKQSAPRVPLHLDAFDANTLAALSDSELDAAVDAAPSGFAEPGRSGARSTMIFSTIAAEKLGLTKKVR